ncbi:hypothetical protein [Dialister succinatiphilus]|uniref:hypothetical protein n=1 Tax=Dialister succinatiphilus TaxID=487173 RepID=UPI003F7F05D7
MDNIICLIAGAFIGSLIASVVISAAVLAGRADDRMEGWRRVEAGGGKIQERSGKRKGKMKWERKD